MNLGQTQNLRHSPLSKRTAVKAYAGYADPGKEWKEVEDVAYNGYQVYLGLRHAF